MNINQNNPKNAQNWVRGFIKCESGVTTTDFMMIATCVVGLGIGSYVAIRDGATIAAVNSSTVMQDGSFDPSDLATRPEPGPYVVDVNNEYETSEEFAGEDVFNGYVPYNEADNGDEGGNDLGAPEAPLGGSAPQGGDTSGDPASDPAGDSSGDPAGDTGGDPAGDTAGDPAGDTTGDPAGDTAGDPASGPAGDTSGDTTGDTSGDTTGDTDTDPAGDTGGGGGGDADVVEEQPDPYQEYLAFYNELYNDRYLQEERCFTSDGAVKLNKNNRIPKRCRDRGLEELLVMQSEVFASRNKKSTDSKATSSV